jgi:hypothetical protein
MGNFISIPKGALISLALTTFLDGALISIKIVVFCVPPG